MSVHPRLRTLDIDIPAKPDILVRLSLLLADDDVNLQAIAELVERDMALAASVMLLFVKPGKARWRED